MFSPDKQFEEWYRTARFAIYVRTSSERQEKEGTSESQLDDIWRYINQNFPWVRKEEVIIYRDDGWSGTNLERPAMDELRMDLRDDKWDVLICYDQDRIARDPYLQLTILEEIEARGKKLLFCTTGAAASGSEDGLLMFEIRGLMAKYERVRSLGRFRIGKLRKARSNKILLSVAPYGYTLVKKHTDEVTGVVTDTHIIINEEEAKIVRMIFSWLGDEGMTLRQIAKRLYEMGVRPRRNKAGKWNTSTLGSLVRNKTYLGVAMYQTTKAAEPKKRLKPITGPIKNRKTTKVPRPQEEWIEITVPAILDTLEYQELFARAQQQLIKNAAISPRKRKNQYLIGGVVRCVCGSARTGEGPKGGRYLYYRCGRRNREFPIKRNCEHAGVNAKIADEAVWNVLTDVVTDPQLLMRAYKKHTASKGNQQQAKLDAVDFELGLCLKQLEDLKQNFINGSISVHDFTELKVGVEKREKELQERKRQIMDTVPAGSINVPDEYLGNLRSFTKGYLKQLSFDQKRGILVRLVESVVAVPGTLEITGHVGVSSSSSDVANQEQVVYSFNSSSSHVKHKTIGRNCRTSKRW